MRFYMDIWTGRIASMVVHDDGSVVFDGVEFASDEEALRSDAGSLWMQSGYDWDKKSHEES